MEILQTLCQVIIGLGILNVWILRFKKKTPYRGGDAGDIKEEFATYGLPVWVMWVVGVTKVCAALALLIGLAVPALILPASITLALLMSGAVLMHVKVKDPARKSLPAACVLVMALFLIYNQSGIQI